MLDHAHDTIDQRIFFDFDWDEFQQFLEIRSERGGNRITYLDGVLEIMSPSHVHEGIKSSSAHAADPDQPRAIRTFLAALRRN